MTGGVLVDTSAWIDALRSDGDPEVRASVRAVTADGTAVLCDMVLLELWNGARGDAEVNVLEQLERNLEVATTAEVVDRSAGEAHGLQGGQARGCMAGETSK